ncbi:MULTISPECIES: iron chelate uptake ABC transporter family permease subunit [unclassified Streptomyces]|uniref:iron chelate uptake ABC transporter family permease subunit n=1 Tax=unclassified Streptomyces TaxID=2593676 RepID=UPI000CD577B2|nr:MULTISPECIES: iron chelate uptake ABC transporter family permease subunit [unclassified Streptomyces]
MPRSEPAPNTPNTPNTPTAAAAPRLPSLPRLSPAARIGLLAVLVAVAAACYLLLFIRGSFQFAFDRRLTTLGTMVVVAFAHAVATAIFQTITHNRILTPSIMGFDSLYVLMQTSMVFVFGGSALARTDGLPKLIVQTVMMVLFAAILYRWLFAGRFANLHLLLLVGVVLGLAFDSVSSFLQRLLSPTDYDMLSVRLFGRMSNSDGSYLPLAFAVCAVVGAVVWHRRYRLDTILLGRDTAVSLGVNHKRELTLMLVLVAVLIAFATALAGPMTFFGFVVTTLAYQLTGSHEHRFVLPMAFLLGLFTLVAGQFVLQHIFYAAGFLTVIIEFAGGIVFLVLLLRKGTL